MRVGVQRCAARPNFSYGFSLTFAPLGPGPAGSRSPCGLFDSVVAIASPRSINLLMRFLLIKSFRVRKPVATGIATFFVMYVAVNDVFLRHCSFSVHEEWHA